jgi:hypothetical protein
LTGQAFRTFTTISMLAALKNQKYPESAVRASAWPSPRLPVSVCQDTVTAKRPPLRQSVVEFGTQAPG